MSAAASPSPGFPSASRATVWVIDANQWPRALLVAELTERGYDVSGFAGIAAALLALPSREAAQPLLALLELAGIEAEPSDLRQLLARGIRLVGICDARSARGRLAAELPWSALLRRPCTIGEIVDRVESLLAP